MDHMKRAHCNLTIMQQIGELKNWHQQQQQIIQQTQFESKNNKPLHSFLSLDFNSIKDLSDMNKKICQTRLENQILETQKTMQCGTVNSTNETKEKGIANFDDLPICTTNTDFNKLIENNMKTSKLANTSSVQKVKHKFLKKGEGTARFGMVLPKQGKKCSVNDVKIVSVTKPQHSEKKIVQYTSDTLCTEKESTNKDIFETHKNSVVFPKSVEQTNPKSISWNSVPDVSPELSKSRDESLLNVNVDSVMLSFIEKILSLEEASKKEYEELKIFGLLEQRVLDSSFSSNSSILTKLMENSVKSTPVKCKPRSDAISGDKELVSNSSRRDKNTINTDVCTAPVESSCDFTNNNQIKKQEDKSCIILPSDNNENEKKQVSQHSNKLSSNNNGDVEKSLHVHFAESDCNKSIENEKHFFSEECIETQKYDSQFRTQNSVSFEDCEEWSCDECNCESNTEYSSEEDCRDVSSPRPILCSNNNSKSANRKTLCDNVLKVKKCEDPDYGVYYITNNNTEDEKTNNSCNIHTTEIKTLDAGNKTDDVCGSVIQARLKELETEIETFRSENNKLKKLRSEYDQEYNKFQNEKKQFLKHLNEEKNKIATDLEEEKRKIAKKKHVFEKYSKTVNKNPSKQERAEILALKQKLTELQEEMNKKESRWGASQARVRNQIRQLEEENKRLKDEIEQIKKVSACNHHISGNYRIQGNPVSNTQLIHIVNKQLSHLVGHLPDFEEGSMHLSKPLRKYADGKIVGQSRKAKELKKVSEAITKLNVCHGSKLKDSDTDVYSEGESNPVKKTTYTETIIKDSEYKNSIFNADKHVLTDKTCKNTTELDDFLENGCEKNEEITTNSETVKEIIVPDGKEVIKEKTFPDGRKEIYYPNGNTKKISPSGDVTKIIYFNGDVKETSGDGTVKYYYAESKVWHITYPDGLEVLDYPNGLVEQRCKNGTVNITFPNGSKKNIFPDNSEEWIYPDGSTMKINLNNDKILILPNGQKEIHTKEHMRREYPDGTIKFVYPDGTQETRYSNGRIRLKDKSGNLVMDSG